MINTQRLTKFIGRLLPDSPRRLLSSFLYKKTNSNNSHHKVVFEQIYSSNEWNSPESKSGEGSTLEATITIRQELPKIIESYAVKTMLDAPCGDFNWMKTVPKTCNYIGGDIVPELIKRNQALYASEKVNFQVLDITKDILPKVDLIFCKDCLQHLSDEKVKLALNNFKRSGSTYLLVTSYPKTWRNYDINDGDYRSLNLLIKPYALTNYMLKIKENATVVGVETDKTMYLYDLKTFREF